MLYNLLVIHGPNLNLLGQREPEIYGYASFSKLCTTLEQKGGAEGVHVENFQSNSEGTLINRLHTCLPLKESSTQDSTKPCFIIINPAGFSHTSVALLDALLATQLPFVEVHLSNIHSRETFRHFSYFSAKAKAVICGMGIQGYLYALDYGIQYIKNSKKN